MVFKKSIISKDKIENLNFYHECQNGERFASRIHISFFLFRSELLCVSYLTCVLRQPTIPTGYMDGQAGKKSGCEIRFHSGVNIEHFDKFSYSHNSGFFNTILHLIHH